MLLLLEEEPLLSPRAGAAALVLRGRAAAPRLVPRLLAPRRRDHEIVVAAAKSLSLRTLRMFEAIDLVAQVLIQRDREAGVPVAELLEAGDGPSHDVPAVGAPRRDADVFPPACAPLPPRRPWPRLRAATGGRRRRPGLPP